MHEPLLALFVYEEFLMIAQPQAPKLMRFRIGGNDRAAIGMRAKAEDFACLGHGQNAGGL
jgi:hypothetical protein